jgi:exodeoxyribonuclease VII large subunit
MSAIGHETDAPLVDYVADVRASTPTDVAKRIVPDLRDEVRLIGQARARMWRTVTGRLEAENAQLDALRSRPVLARPDVIIEDRASDVSLLAIRGERAFGHRLDGAERDLVHTIARLRALSPKATLDRGYAIVQHAADDRLVRDAGAVAPGERLRIRVAAGEFGAVVADTGKPETDAPEPQTDTSEPRTKTTKPKTNAAPPEDGRHAAAPNGHSPAKASRPNASRSRR